VSAGLTIASVSVERGGRAVLSDISLAVPPGAVAAVIGPNGSGKSTLAMAALGLIPLAHGRIDLGGREVNSLDAAERARRVAYVPQRSGLIAPLPVAAVVAQGRFAHGAATWPRLAESTRQAVAAALAAVDASHLAARPFSELSGGECQRVLIARALATGAEVLVLDEPTSALDIGHRLALLALIRRLAADGKAVLIALHDLDEVTRIADRVLLLHEGRALARGSAAEVVAPGPVREAYGVDLRPGEGLGYRAI
jgi:iron complex transport system ATP-binding protein